MPQDFEFIDAGITFKLAGYTIALENATQRKTSVAEELLGKTN